MPPKTRSATGSGLPKTALQSGFSPRGAEEAPKAPPKEKGECVGALSLSYTSTQFSRWRLRFKAHCREVNVSLVPLFESGVTDASANRDHRDLFSSLLIRFVGDDVLEFFHSCANIEERPIAFLSLLTKHFSALSCTEECTVELFFAALRSRRNYFPSLSAFIGHLQRAAVLISSSYPESRTTQAFVERLLILVLISGLNSAPWANPLISAARMTMRKGVTEQLSFFEFCTALLQACPFDPEATAPHAASSSSSPSSASAVVSRPRHAADQHPRLNEPPPNVASVNCVMTISDETSSFLSDAVGVAERDQLNTDVWHFRAERYE